MYANQSKANGGTQGRQLISKLSETPTRDVSLSWPVYTCPCAPNISAIGGNWSHSRHTRNCPLRLFSPISSVYRRVSLLCREEIVTQCVISYIVMAIVVKNFSLKVCIWEENVLSPSLFLSQPPSLHPMYHTRTVRVCWHKMSRTRKCPALIAVHASQR